MEERARFVFEYERDERTMTELCEDFGISRECGYRWLRVTAAWPCGLVELDRDAVRHPTDGGCD